jgi:signal transduction histidine kinase
MAVKGLELGAFDFLKKPYDITELILKSRNLCRLKLYYNRQLELLTRLEDANIKLEKSNKQKDEVLRIVSHDMRNPLGNMIGLAQILYEEPNQLPDDTQNIAEIIIRSGENLLSIVNTLLDAARLEAGKITIDYAQVDLNTLIEHEIEQFNIAAKQKDIQLRYVSEIKNELFTLDEAKIRQSVANLISNAIKFTPEKGTVTVSLTKSETDLFIKVKDSGIGIADTDIPYLFDKFSIVQRHGTKNERGTGLGLSIVKAFVSLHKGTVTVESEKEKGTEFTIQIPLF